MAYRLGVDVGGTFTDSILINEETGEMHIGKVSSTPNDPSIGFLEVTQRMLRKASHTASDLSYVVHGTTVATNAIIEGKTARTAFITTQGFRDMLEIARQIRPTLYDTHFEKPRPLVPRHLCFEVPERLDARGRVLTPLDAEAVRDISTRMRADGVDSVAVCLLHSYVNPAHEKRIGELLREALPEAVVTLSAEVAPEFREYFRASTTVINATIRPVVARYLARIEERLRAEGLQGELLVMQSNGGVATFAAASERPVFMVESGPAAGVMAATRLAAMAGYQDILSFDMGGTTAKVGLVQNGTPVITKDYEVGAIAKGRSGGGYPIRTPVIDLVEIGAGGGSIAWVDPGGVLRVGPQSAGADPGPVCYGRGGKEPTVTDANLVLGRLNPHYFLGGEVPLDPEAAHEAIRKRIAAPLDLDVVEAAHGIIEIANAAMANAFRLISIQRGHDPRDFVLVAFGGAGPLHANRLADELGIPTVLIPMSPGIASSIGLLFTDLKHEHYATILRNTKELDSAELERVLRTLEETGTATLTKEGVLPAQMTMFRQAEMRYVGQSHELTVAIPSGSLGRDELNALIRSFHHAHEQAYGYQVESEPTEIVNVRVTAIGTIAKPRFPEVRESSDGSLGALKGKRQVYFAETNGFVDCPIYDRYKLGFGDRLSGPAVVEELDSTTVIQPHYQSTVVRHGNLVLAKAAS